MRTENSIKNISLSMLAQVVITLLGFVSRKVFINNLGAEYLGVNGLLTNVLSMLSLIEGGIGASIVYNLYKPLAENDTEGITALVQLYKRIYGVLAVGIFLLSLLIYPLLQCIITVDTGVEYIVIVYFIFVIKNVVSYLNAHKWSLITTDQKGYILTKYNLIFNIITTVAKIIVLQITKNYVLFLGIELVIFTVQNLWNGKIVNKRYPYIKTKEKFKVDTSTKQNLVKNVKALFIHNIGSYCVFGTDNLLIGGFVSVAAVGLYSNYTMVIGQLGNLLRPILSGIGASIGNLLATEEKDKSYNVFNVVYLINFWIYSFSVIFLFNLLEPFINWAFGKGLLLDPLSFVFALFNFYLSGMRSSIITFKTKGGIFSEDKYIPLLEATINLGASIILVKYFGLAGILMGTSISTILVPLWSQSRLVYNKIFGRSVKEYFKKYFIYLIITITIGYITTYLCNILVEDIGFAGLVKKGTICVVVTNLTYYILFFRTKEFRYILTIVRSVLKNKQYRIPLRNKNKNGITYENK